MKKMTRENKQLELPVLTNLNNRGGSAASTASASAPSTVTRDARSQLGSHKEANSGNLSIYQTISANYFSKRS